MEVIFESTAFPCNRNCKFRLFLCAHGRRLDKFSYVYKNCAYKFDLRDSLNKTFQKRKSYNLHFGGSFVCWCYYIIRAGFLGGLKINFYKCFFSDF